MAWLLPLLFIVVPVLELSLLAWSRDACGFPHTFGLIVVSGVLGASLARHQGLATWKRFQEATARGEMPHKEMVDGLLILVAGAVLLTPGFITDSVGFLLLVPPLRALLRRSVAGFLAKRVRVQVSGSMSGAGTPHPSPPASGVIDAEFTVQRSQPEHGTGNDGGDGTGKALDEGTSGS